MVVGLNLTKNEFVWNKTLYSYRTLRVDSRVTESTWFYTLDELVWPRLSGLPQSKADPPKTAQTPLNLPSLGRNYRINIKPLSHMIPDWTLESWVLILDSWHWTICCLSTFVGFGSWIIISIFTPWFMVILILDGWMMIMIDCDHMTYLVMIFWHYILCICIISV